MLRSILLRFVLPVAFASCVVAYFGLPYIQRLLAEWFRSDVELRAQLVMHTMEEPVTELVDENDEGRLRVYLSKVTADERLLAILICRPDGSTIIKTERTPAAISCAGNASQFPLETRVVQLSSGSVQVSRFDFDSARPPFRVLMLHDLSFVDRRQRTARDFVLVFIGISVLLLALLVVLAAWLQLRRWANVLDRRYPGETVSRRRQVAKVVPADPVTGARGACRGGTEAEARNRFS
jgi:trehalose 6-phosphate synthase